MWKGKETSILPKIVLKKNSAGGIGLTDYKTYYIAMVLRLYDTGEGRDT